MGDILNFQPKNTTTNKNKVDATVTRIKTNQDIFQETWEDVWHDWQSSASKNRLNLFIESKIPSFAKGADNADYLNDLNVIAHAEQKLGMLVTVAGPKVTASNPETWIVGFHRGTELFTSSPDLPSEANSRALNVLLFLSFSFRMKKLNR